MKTQEHRTVSLTLAQWNIVLCQLADAWQYQKANDYPALAKQTREFQEFIREQVGYAITAAFAADYPVKETGERHE